MLTLYVILAVVAAAVVAAIARPSQYEVVREILVAGELSIAENSSESSTVEFRCLSSGRLTITRRGIAGIADDGACSLAISIKGTDINIEERLTPGRQVPAFVLTATFDIGYIREGYYHIRYNSAKAALWTALTLHVRQGFATSRPLHH